MRDGVHLQWPNLDGLADGRRQQLICRDADREHFLARGRSGKKLCLGRCAGNSRDRKGVEMVTVIVGTKDVVHVGDLVRR